MPLLNWNPAKRLSAIQAQGGIYVFGLSTDTSVLCAKQNQGWAPASLGGSFSGSPAVAVTADGRLELFARGTDNAVWHSYEESPGGSWSAWFSLGGAHIQDPVVGTNADGTLTVFGVQSDKQMWYRRQSAVSGAISWSDWASLGGVSTSQHAVIREPGGLLVVFALGSDNGCWHTWQTSPSSNNWSDWATLGGTHLSPPFVILNADGRMEVFGRGTDNAVWTLWKTSPNGGWDGWASLGGNVTGPFFAGVRCEGGVELFVLDAGTNQWKHRCQSALSSGWSDWASVSLPSTGQPALIRDLMGYLHIFAVDNNNTLCLVSQQALGGVQWSAAASPAAAPARWCTSAGNPVTITPSSPGDASTLPCPTATYDVHAGANALVITATGGRGASGNGFGASSGGSGGRGATVRGVFSALAGQRLYIMAGQDGYNGGFPGGGDGKHRGGGVSYVATVAPTRSAQAPRTCLVPSSPAETLLIAGGGGGGGGNGLGFGDGGNGGNAGLLGGAGATGGAGSGSQAGGAGHGGTQIAGGQQAGSATGWPGPCPWYPGDRLHGGDSTENTNGSGGAGYYGGGSGSPSVQYSGDGGGGGGSSYLSTSAQAQVSWIDQMSSPGVTIAPLWLSPKMRWSNAGIGGANSPCNVLRVSVNLPPGFAAAPAVVLATPRGGDFADTFSICTSGVGLTSSQINVLRSDIAGNGWGQNLGVSLLAGEAFTSQSLQCGSADVGGSSSLFLKSVVPFPQAFSEAPRILVTARGEDHADTFATTILNTGAAGFTVNIKRLDGGLVWGQDLRIDWVAFTPAGLARFNATQAAHGVMNVGSGAVGVTRVYVSFGQTFAGPPSVFLTPHGEPCDDVFAVAASNITTTGFTANIRRVDILGNPGYGWGQNLQLEWLALL